MLTEKEIVDAFYASNPSMDLDEGWPGLVRFGRAIEELVKKEHGIGVPVEAADCHKEKPLFGVIPERLWKETRVWDLINCLSNHSDNRKPIHELWLDELRRLLNDVLYK